MATSDSQQTLSAYTAGTGTETVTQTIVAPLQVSQRKLEKVRTAVEEFQAMCRHLNDHMPSIPPHERVPRNPALYRIVTRGFPESERTVSAKVATAATRHVAAAYQSWQSRGRPGERPAFGDGEFFKLDTQQLTLVSNDRGFGLKANFVPYNPEWFHIDPRPYVRSYLERVCDGEATFGTAEFRVREESVSLHLPIRWDVEVYEPDDVTTTVGVDIGETAIYAAVVVSGDEVVTASVKRGAEFRHYRDRLGEKRARLQEQGDLRGVRQCRNEQERYTEQVLDTASREIVDLAVEHSPAKIHLEELTYYREHADDPIHDWPFALLQEKVAYKAAAEGVPVEVVDPKYTSITCRQCGQTNAEYRDGTEFECSRCGYEVHADVNAAINIAYA
jgi:IS605 OrfB family transposase